MLRNTCNTLQQNATKLNINTLTTDKILSLPKTCQHFWCFFRLTAHGQSVTSIQAFR